MSREVNKITCSICESSYKLVFDLDETSGYPKVCPFCASEIYADEDQEEEDDG